MDTGRHHLSLTFGAVVLANKAAEVEDRRRDYREARMKAMPRSTDDGGCDVVIFTGPSR